MKIQPIIDSVAGNDSDPDGDDLTYSLVIGPAHGSVTLNPDGTFNYTPDPDYNLTAGRRPSPTESPTPTAQPPSPPSHSPSSR